MKGSFMKVEKNCFVVLRKVHDTFFLINIADNYHDEECRLYEVNEIGAYIWKEIDGDFELEIFVKKMLEKIENPKNICFQKVCLDVKEYVENLIKQGFIKVEGN